MPRRASRGSGPSREPIGTDHTPWPALAPAREQLVGRHPARRRRALHEGHGQVAPHGVAGEHDPRVRRAHPRSRPPRLEPHEHAVALDEPLLVHDVEAGRLGVDAVQLGQQRSCAGRPRRCPRAARRRAARRPSRRARRSTGSRGPRTARAPRRCRAARSRSCRGTAPGRGATGARQPQPPDGEGRRRPDAGHGLPPGLACGVVARRARATPPTTRAGRPGRGRARRRPPGPVLVRRRPGGAVQHRDAVRTRLGDRAHLAPGQHA